MGLHLLQFWEIHSVDLLELIKDMAASAVILTVGIALSKGAQRLIKKTDSAKFPVEGQASSMLRAVVRYGILVICLIMILNIFGINTTSLLAVLGAAGVAVGLALRDVMGNIASGMILLILGSYRVGEFVEFGAYSGTVKEIHLFTTILETPDGIYVSAPNSSIWSGPIKNYTRNGKRRIDLSIGIAYSDSVDTAFQVMQGIIAEEPAFLKEPEAQVILQSIETNSVKITIRAWVPVQDYWNINWELSKRIKAKIEAAGLRIPLPQQDVRIVQG